MTTPSTFPNSNFPNLDFVKQFWSGLPGLGGGLGVQLGSQFTPTLDVEELEKRINDLRTVEQWLNFNLSLLRTSIQALEVQRGTLVALKSFSDTLHNHSSPSISPSSTSSVSSNASNSAMHEDPIRAQTTSTASLPEMLDPNYWWRSLQDQFSKVAEATLASNSPSNAANSSKNPEKQDKLSAVVHNNPAKTTRQRLDKSKARRTISRNTR